MDGLVLQGTQLGACAVTLITLYYKIGKLEGKVSLICDRLNNIERNLEKSTE